MNVQHQRRALSAIAAGLVMVLAGCANAAAAQPPSPPAATASASPTRATPTQTSTAAPQAGAKPSVGGDNQTGCAARAMARGTFNPACSEYQGYLDPGTAGGRAPTSGEIQQQNLCRSGEIPKSEC